MVKVRLWGSAGVMEISRCPCVPLSYKPVDHKLILLPLREAFEDLFSQTYSRKQNLTFLGHVQTCFRSKRWQDLLKLMDHVCKSALTKELHKKPDGTAFVSGARAGCSEQKLHSQMVPCSLSFDALISVWPTSVPVEQSSAE